MSRLRGDKVEAERADSFARAGAAITLEGLKLHSRPACERIPKARCLQSLSQPGSLASLDRQHCQKAVARGIWHAVPAFGCKAKPAPGANSAIIFKGSDNEDGRQRVEGPCPWCQEVGATFRAVERKPVPAAMQAEARSRRAESTAKKGTEGLRERDHSAGAVRRCDPFCVARHTERRTLLEER